MKKQIKLHVLILLFLGANSIQAQYISSVSYPDSTIAIVSDTMVPSVRYAQTITAQDMYDHLSVLASDEYEGRETGQKGNMMAAAYLSNFLKNHDFQTSTDHDYYQPVQFTFSAWADNSIFINGNKYKHLWDYLAFTQQTRSIPKTNLSKVQYRGYGIKDPAYNDYKKCSAEGKTIMISEGIPVDKDGKPRVGDEWTLDKKLVTAAEEGASLVLIITKDIKKLLSENRHKVLGSTTSLGDLRDSNIPGVNHIYISSTMAKDIIGKKGKKFTKNTARILKRGKSKPITFKTDVTIEMTKNISYMDGYNVLGFIEGSDPKLKEEIVVVSAHFDHLGKRGDSVYNGADDNGSGTTTILEIAEAFKKAESEGQGPRRSILFLWVTGEEKGLLGSSFYADSPVYPLENTMVDINVDMVGRVDEKYKDNPNYIYVIGSDRLSSRLHQDNEEVNQKYSHLVLDYQYNDEDDPNRYYYRSDHYNFASRGIPAIFFFNGTHEDYHQITDTVDKINFEKMARVGRHIFHLAWRVANQDEKITVDVK